MDLLVIVDDLSPEVEDYISECAWEAGFRRPSFAFKASDYGHNLNRACSKWLSNENTLLILFLCMSTIEMQSVKLTFWSAYF
jgi:hypothetical protein